MNPSEVLIPKGAEDLAAALLSACMHEERPVLVQGGGSRERVGRGPAPNFALALDLGAFSGILEYEPTELVITAGAATPLATIEAALEAQDQMLAFEPPNHGALCGRPGARPTLGGVLASNSSGPRRLTAGAARDHFLGFAAVSGRGDAFRAGGKVVKNVTGFDLSKVMAGSWGTLAVLTEVSVKVAPRPERSSTLLVAAPDAEEALSLMASALGTAVAPTAAAYLPAPVARRLLGREAGTVCLRLEATERALVTRRDHLTTLFGAAFRVEDLEGPEERRLWKAIADVEILADPQLPLWRISVPADRSAELLAQLPPENVIVDWAGNLVWLSAPAPPKLGRDMGHVQYWGGAPSDVPIQSQLGPAERQLSARLQSAFDPSGILNRNRGFPPQIESKD